MNMDKQRIKTQRQKTEKKSVEKWDKEEGKWKDTSIQIYIIYI